VVLVFHTLGLGLVAQKLDPRWKVVVSRVANRGISFWRVVSVDFATTKDAAEQRRAGLLTGWQPGQFTDSNAMRWTDVRRARRAP
jgi:hypothetical protein